MNYIEKLDKYFQSLSGYKLVILLWLLSYALTIPIVLFQIVMKQRPLWNFYGAGNVNIITLLVVAIFLQPFIETFIFQSCIFNLLGKVELFSENKLWIMIVSGLIFGLAHNYSSLYMLSGVIVGLILAYGYVIFDKRKSSPYLMVSTIQILRNIVAVGLYIVLK